MEMSHYAKRLAPDSAGKPATEFVDGPKDAARVATWGLRSEHLESRLYLRNEQGRMLSGFDALLALWDRMPTYRGVARLLRAPGLHTVGVGLYDHVVAPSLTACARRRRRVALRMR
jgi:hypothetical protein